MLRAVPRGNWREADLLDAEFTKYGGDLVDSVADALAAHDEKYGIPAIDAFVATCKTFTWEPHIYEVAHHLDPSGRGEKHLKPYTPYTLYVDSETYAEDLVEYLALLRKRGVTGYICVSSGCGWRDRRYRLWCHWYQPEGHTNEAA